MTSNIRLLDANQTQTFDVEYVNSDMFKLVRAALIDFMPINDFSFVDVGGGNGHYADQLLSAFPSSSVTVVEPDEYLLSKNKENARKHLIAGIYQDAQLDEGAYDVVGFNWVLHHFVGNSYNKTLQFQREGLEKAYRQLKPGGLLFIFENFYDGAIFNDLPGGLIYQLTASKALQRITHKLGANTAGVGVCFHSENKWASLVEQQGFTLLSQSNCYDFGNLSRLKKMILHISKQRVGFMVAQKPA